MTMFVLGGLWMKEKEPVYIQDRRVFRSGNSLVVVVPASYFEEGELVRFIIYDDGSAELKKLEKNPNTCSVGVEKR